jgi:hypothetical protein
LTRRASEWLVPLLLLFLGGKSAAAAPSPSPGPPAPPTPLPPSPGGGGSGREVARVRTGEDDLAAWKRRRLALLVPTLNAVASEQGLTPPPGLIDRIALSLLAQWAHETARGTHEFNFNLGGWRARSTDDFFAARDAQSGREVFRWTAYAELGPAIEDQVRRLVSGFPSAVRMLITNPESSAWVEELGRLGYYQASPTAYAHAWATQRTELGAIP